MNDHFESWKRARAEGTVPDGFLDRVVARAASLDPSRVPLAIALAAGVACALRVASTFLIFVTS
jgi:hypothetical protein